MTKVVKQILGAAAILLLASGCGQVPGLDDQQAAAKGGKGDKGGDDSDGATGPVVSACAYDQADATACPESMNIVDLNRVHFGVEYKTDRGTHEQRLEVFDPDGFVYDVMSQTFDVARKNRSVSVWEQMMVNGTPIEYYHMCGTWQVDVYLDSAPAASFSFTLL
jgi:hypothetical protein